MSLFAVLALAVFAVAAVTIGLAVARALDEVQQLRMELERARRVQPLLAHVGTEAQRLRRTLARVGRR